MDLIPRKTTDQIVFRTIVGRINIEKYIFVAILIFVGLVAVRRGIRLLNVFVRLVAVQKRLLRARRNVFVVAVRNRRR